MSADAGTPITEGFRQARAPTAAAGDSLSPRDEIPRGIYVPPIKQNWPTNLTG